MKKPRGLGWTFVIEAVGSERRAIGDKLSITDAGWAKLWHRDTLVGVFRDGSWLRIYIEAASKQEDESSQ